MVYYDQFLTTANGTRLVNGGAQFNTSLTTLTDGIGRDVYFSGANAVVANGGQLVPIYSPRPLRPAAASATSIRMSTA